MAWKAARKIADRLGHGSGLGKRSPALYVICSVSRDPEGERERVWSAHVRAPLRVAAKRLTGTTLASTRPLLPASTSCYRDGYDSFCSAVVLAAAAAGAAGGSALVASTAAGTALFRHRAAGRAA